MSAVKLAEDRAVQVLRNNKVALTLAACHAEQGSYPESLEALVPRYMATIPGDLFMAGPLKYKPRNDGYVLYSVGPNGVDEGGHGYDDEPRGDDLPVRMPPPPVAAEEALRWWLN